MVVEVLSISKEAFNRLSDEDREAVKRFWRLQKQTEKERRAQKRKLGIHVMSKGG